MKVFLPLKLYLWSVPKLCVAIIVVLETIIICIYFAKTSHRFRVLSSCNSTRDFQTGMQKADVKTETRAVA